MIPIRSFIPPRVVQTLKRQIAISSPTLSAESIIVFVCGADPSEKKSSGREVLMEYAAKNLHHFRFFKAEDVFSMLEAKEGVLDLLTVEERLTTFSDCIIIIAEGDGALAELGAFTFSDKIGKKVLIINDEKYKGSTSFIVKGPIAKSDAESSFKPAIYTDLRSISKALPLIVKKLQSIEKKYGKSYPMRTFEEFSGMQHKIKMLFLLDLINLFSPISHAELIQVLQAFYGDHNFDISVEMAMLRAIGLIVDCKAHYLRSLKERGNFFKFQYLDPLKLRADVINYYHKYCWQKVDCLKIQRK